MTVKEESKDSFLSTLTPGRSDSNSQTYPSKTAVKKEDEPSSAFCVSPMLSLTESSDSKEGVKVEPNVDSDSSPSSAMDHDDVVSPKSEPSSATPTPPPVQESTTSSGSSSKASTPPPPTPAPRTNSRKRSAASTMPTQFIGHLPVAREEAMSTFVEIRDNVYQYKTLGRSRELQESMICDCTFDPETDDPEYACGHGSDCINRLTQIECLPEDCRCRSHCQNQRFQKKEYANIEIVKTEMKGFGLRAEVDLPRDTFIYEYVGDVVSTSSFKKRMRDYANEGIEHFYFMMLQKDEFIDATKSGGIGRFANHSCNPNCYVAKWTIGDYVRMGIFAKRKIKKDEELTFNYNVDRYGHQAQTCYCGEPNCVGYIGGKTQTDISTMDELYLDALGITDDAELMELKGTKKKKGKKIDDPDFMPQMKPVTEKDVPKVVQAIRQTQSKKVLYKLLTRLKITEEQAALRQVMRLRGYSLMKNLLEDYADDTDILGLALECMWTWPLSFRNKVEDSQVVVPVKACTESENEAVKQWATKLHEHWATLELSYRIPRLPKKALVKEEEKPEPEPEFEFEYDPEPAPSNTTRRYNEGFYELFGDIPDRPLKRFRKRFRPTIPSPLPPPKEPTPPPQPSYQQKRLEEQKKQNLAINEIIAAAAAARAAEKAAAEEAALAQAEKEAQRAEKEAERQRRKEKGEGGAGGSSNGKKRDREKRRKEKGESEQDKEALKEKKLLKLISPIVVKAMSKHAEVIGHDRFKRHAKELTEKIAASEKSSSAYRHNQLDTLSDEKVAKIKKYSKQYIDKILHKIEKHKKDKLHRKPSSTSTGHSSLSMTPSAVQNTPSTSTGTPNSADLPPTMADIDLDDSMDMDMNSESGSEDEDGDVELRDQADDPDEGSLRIPAADSAMDIRDGDMMDAMDLDTPVQSQRASDPRQRPPNDVSNGHS